MKYTSVVKRAMCLLFISLLFAPKMQAQSYNPFSTSFNYQQGQLTFLTVAGLSVLGAEIFDKNEKLNFYIGQADLYFSSGSYTNIAQSVGVERRSSPWFGFALEANVQEMFSADHSTMGFGISGQFRWYILGKKKISPYFEYQNGVFYGVSPFPEGAHNFTFRLVYKLGVEYTLSDDNRIRADFGHLHHSNSGLFEPNIGYDGYGISVVYLWKMNKKGGM
jgi:hypothetical protein